MMRILTPETPDLEDEWDPQGLNSLAKDELESFGIDDEEEDTEMKIEVDSLTIIEGSEENEEVRSSDLDRDGLTELEEMEKSLLAEESPLDFVMIGEE
jgi:hypothetical protein